MKSLLKIFFIGIFLSLLGCKKEQAKIQPQTFHKEVITRDHNQTITAKDVQMYHEDIIYNYEYRNGSSDNYKHSYLVYGLDQEGDSVSGIINIKGKHGAGTIINSDKETVDIQVEWIDYGKLKGTDNKGNVYLLDSK